MNGHCRVSYFFLPTVDFGLDGEAVFPLGGLSLFFDFLSFFDFLGLGDLGLVDPGELLASSELQGP